MFVMSVPLAEQELDELEAWLRRCGTDGAEAAMLVASARERNVVTVALIPEYRDALLSALESRLEEAGDRGWSKRLIDLRDALVQDARERGAPVRGRPDDKIGGFPDAAADL